MKYLETAQGLRKQHSDREIAEFLISPVHRPDMVMTALLNKRARVGAAPPPPPRPTLPRRHRQSGWSVKIVNNVLARNLLLVGMFMFLSCALAPSRELSGQFSDRGREFLSQAAIGPEFDLERIDSTLQAGWFVAGKMIEGGQPPDKLSESFAGRLLLGEWAGIALIDRQGRIKATARPGEETVVERWIKRQKELKRENHFLKETIEELRLAHDSDKIYIEIDLDMNLLYLKMGAQRLYEFPIVSGRGYTTRESGRKRRFATPRGIHTVLSKERNPVWRPPAWHWAETGRPQPSRPVVIRRVLGKYRLNLGNAYGIHGTASGSIGRPGKYSHGCIRMNHQDLEIVFKLCDVGTRVYIY